MTVLETERLLLRPLTGADFEDYAEMLADPEVASGLAETVSTGRADAWRSLAMFIGHREIRGYSHWALVEKATGAFVGRAGPWRPHGFPGLGVGWCLSRRHWGKGYAAEAGRAAVAHCFAELGADEVISLILPGNSRSISVAERIGHTHLRDSEYRGRRVHIYGQRAAGQPT
ncbi:GNAT family N-acetyltransferase [Actinomadura syzygii]|uniref:GNAT family N-acetyltransferase n=1 Tax=Actinomadura syzygii TaxID=1427538 RepID=A0A5D0U9T0_9ACTN|nr:GNAT family N-acetyltransferase [Actinomadura syzygii]TYC15108.1 GNAT family N-acetyltransferase [Actinomadura syzygii]